MSATSLPRRITSTDQPVFPCWLWHTPLAYWVHHTGVPTDILANAYTHWLPDQSEAPTCVPTTVHDIPSLGDQFLDHRIDSICEATALRTRVAELEKDGARLDWLEMAEKTNHPSCPENDGNSWRFPYLMDGAGGFGGGVGHKYFDSLRAAIDAARQPNLNPPAI